MDLQVSSGETYKMKLILVIKNSNYRKFDYVSIVWYANFAVRMYDVSCRLTDKSIC